MRKALVQLLDEHRDEAGRRWTPAEWSRRSGVSRSTIGRLLSLKKFPAYTTTLDTVHALVIAMKRNGGMFIAQFEEPAGESRVSENKSLGDVSRAVTAGLEHKASPPEQQGADGHIGAADGDYVSVTLEIPRLTVEESRLLRHLGFILLRISDAPLIQAEDQPAAGTPPGSRSAGHSQR